MTALQDARHHLAKAKEFLASAEDNRDLERYNAATSDAVISGINSKDAICLALTGKTGKSDNHSDAVKELRLAGGGSATLAAKTKGLATSLGRLMPLKTKSQYTALGIARRDAIDAVSLAQRLLDGAETIVTE